MLTKRQIESIFDEIVEAEVGTEALFYFPTHQLRESARVRFIAQKANYEARTGNAAPVGVSRTADNKSEKGVILRRLQESNITGYIRYPGQQFQVYKVPVRQTEIALPDFEPDLSTLADLLRAEGLTEEQIAIAMANDETEGEENILSGTGSEE